MSIRNDFVLSQIDEGYLVGGTVRDFLLGKSSCDRDIAIKGAEQFAQGMAKQFDGTFIVLDELNHIYRVVLKDKVNYLDISELQGETIEEDLLRRDFTINAIAYDLKENKFIDVTGGIDDLKQGVLRHIKDENFADDPLRVLRAFRFAAVTGFEMTAELKTALRKYLPLALNPAPERIHYELMKLFGGVQTAKTLLLMDEFGFLEQIFPCVKEMKKVPPNSHHHLDLFHHVVETVRQVEIAYKDAPIEVKEHLDKVDFGGFPRINQLKLAGFLHDIGKFSTWTVEQTGRHRFIKHDDVGSKMVVPFLKHYVRKMEDNVVDNIILARADRLSARGIDVTEEMVKNNLDGLDKLLNFYLSKRETLEPIPKLLDGKEIMELKGLKPSKLF